MKLEKDHSEVKVRVFCFRAFVAVDVVHVLVSTSAASIQDGPDYCTYQN